ncbi:uncharacterized protein [Musca autumnalis]|uniref:uncharacterized protein n=1 Tax=Musca autumnalis TaxID=221902 RepID=UPI003CFA0C69
MTIYKKIKENYNKTTQRITKQYSKCNKSMASLKTSTSFLIKCKKVGIIPHFISNSTSNIYNIFKINKEIPPNIKSILDKHVYHFHNKILNLLIQQKHNTTHKTRVRREKLQAQITELLQEEDIYLFMESERKLQESYTNTYKSTQIKKLKSLQQHNTEIKMDNRNGWFVNKTNTEFPNDIEWLLALGPKYATATTTKTFPLFDVIAEGEDCIKTIDDKEQQEIARTQLVSIIDEHMKNKTTTTLHARDKQILSTVGRCRSVLKENDDIIIVNADKGGKTVAMYKKEYQTKMATIVGDMCTYRRLKIDPTNILQNKNNLLVEKLFKLGIINEAEKYKLTNKTSTAPRLYGLPKIHKDGNPLRPICSTINSPANGLCKYVVDILKNLTVDSIYNVKDAKDFKTKIENIKINPDEVLISFDVVSLFPSIPVNLVLNTIEDKWDTIKTHTTIPKELFMDILTLCIKDTRYFIYDDKFYKQNKGMPMGSPASPVIADIVMEQLLDSSLMKMWMTSLRS